MEGTDTLHQIGMQILNGLPPEERCRILEHQLKELSEAQSQTRVRFSAIELATRAHGLEPEQYIQLARQIERYLQEPAK